MRFYINLSYILTVLITSKVNAQSANFWSRAIKNKDLKQTKQAYCYRHQNGEIMGENIDKIMSPASVSKIYLSYFALKKLGAYYRFKTRILIKEDHIHIQGGHDPNFTSENLFYLFSKLNKLGIYKIKKLSFDKNFYFNRSLPKNHLAWLLKGYANTEKWSIIHKVEYQNLLFQISNLDLNLFLPETIDFRAKYVFEKNTVDFSSFKQEIYFESSPLHRHLKQMNIYSSNFIADNLFEDLGGVNEFSLFMKREFNVGSETIHFDNGAGFEPNYTNCRLTIYLIEKLKEYLSTQGLEITDLLSVAGEDMGTLANRYKKEYKKTIAAKTGSLRHTSTLAGVLNTESSSYAFSIFNHTYKLQRARELQDYIIKKIFEIIGYPERLRYKHSDYIPLIDSRASDRSL
jgi:serine-type D-Ala-D-Ala carboxypeptidase/endopeptidase (penicillin-binding protein 4)